MQTTIDKNTELATERVDRARAELILDQTFYGVLVSQVSPVPSRRFPTMATNGKVHFFNPEFIIGLPQKKVLGTQAHELEHDARRHHTRRGDRDPVEWNKATDYAINIDLIDAGFELPDGALIDEKYRGMSAEDIYRTRELDRQQQQKQQQGEAPDADEDETEEGLDQADTDPGQKPGDDEGDDGDEQGDEQGDEPGNEPGGDEGDDGEGPGEGQGDDGDADDEGQGSGDGEEADDEGQGEADGEGQGEADGEGQGGGSGDADDAQGPGQGRGEGEGGEGSEGGHETSPKSSGDPGGCGEVLDAADDAAELADADAKWERVLRQAAMLAAKRGDAPGHVAREIARADHPPQDWRETLRAYFDGGAATVETWNRPNRRFIGGGLYLPGREREGINRAVFMIDTSGSMFDGIALEAVAVETQAALDERIIDEVIVLYGDTRVTRVDTYRSGDEIEFDARGGGGTELKPLFDYVRDEVDSPTLVVCFTDGYIDDVTGGGTVEPPCQVLWAFTGYPMVVRQHMANTPWGADAIDVGAH